MYWIAIRITMCYVLSHDTTSHFTTSSDRTSTGDSRLYLVQANSHRRRSARGPLAEISPEGPERANAAAASGIARISDAPPQGKSLRLRIQGAAAKHRRRSSLSDHRSLLFRFRRTVSPWDG